MKIKALVEKWDKEVEIEVELPYYSKERIATDNGFAHHYTKVDVDQIVTISQVKDFEREAIYNIDTEKSPNDWMNTLDSFYFLGMFKSKARSFELAYKRAAKWNKKQQKLISSITP